MTIHCQERYDAARAYAESVGMLENFDGCFERLRQHEQRDYRPVEVNVYSDWEKHSFYFEEEYKDEDLKGKVSLNGGIIFHGVPEEGYRPAMSVQLCPSYGWSIHT